jgi:hypothetical protein
MQELVDYADVRRVLPVTRIRLGAMDLQELLSYMTNASISFAGLASAISNASWSTARAESRRDVVGAILFDRIARIDALAGTRHQSPNS